MDVIIIALIEKHIDIPFDIVLFLNEFVKYTKINDDNIHNAVNLWCKDKQLCMFYYGHISYWNVSKVTNMNTLFRSNYMFNENISKWDVSNVENMFGMFNNALNFQCDLSSWNVSNVKDMSYMFYGANNFNSNISNWNVKNVQKTKCMFGKTQIIYDNIKLWSMSSKLKFDAFYTIMFYRSL